MHVCDIRVGADFVLCSDGSMFLSVQGGHVPWQTQRQTKRPQSQ